MTIDFPAGLGNIVYEYDYFAGSQILTYFEHVLVDDCVRIAFSVQQSRRPIYGYASQYYNALASGTVIVTGSFWIAFKEAGYIPVILRDVARMRTVGGSGEFFSSPADWPESGSLYSSSLSESSARWEGNEEEGGARQAGLARRASIERMLEASERDGDSVETARALQQVMTDLQAMDDQQFENFAEQFEDALWYGGNRPQDGRGDAMSGNLNPGPLSDDEFLAYRRGDQYPPFDIIVTFGDMNTPAANHTLHRVCDTSIIGTEYVIEPTGDPVLVRYDFVARNLM